MADKRNGARAQTSGTAKTRGANRKSTASRAEKQGSGRKATATGAEKQGSGRKATATGAEKQGSGRKATATRAEKQGAGRKATASRAGKHAAGRKETTGGAERRPDPKRGAEHKQTSASEARESAAAGRNGLSASDAVSRARRALTGLLGLPVEGVLGIDRDGAAWVATVQVLELARIPNTTDVLGEYETVLDGEGEVIRYHRVRRYHRGQIEGGQ